MLKEAERGRANEQVDEKGSERERHYPLRERERPYPFPRERGTTHDDEKGRGDRGTTLERQRHYS